MAMNLDALTSALADARATLADVNRQLRTTLRDNDLDAAAWLGSLRDTLTRRVAKLQTEMTACLATCSGDNS